jgi:hypothetical protein
MAIDLLHTHPVDTGEWQSMDTSGSRAHRTYELQDVILEIDVPWTMTKLQQLIKPDLPWAETHFQERMSGEPLNPPPSHVDWPHAKRGNDDHTSPAGQFSHTYPERFWPRHAGNDYPSSYNPEDKGNSPRSGVRFEYGDLADVTALLVKRPQTRQAFLPVWFPEDTGGSVRIGDRVPCTLGYHFMIRHNVLSCRYFIRSCDIVRHFSNDVYMAARLMHWMLDQLNAQCPDAPLKLGHLTMFISSLHAFVADASRVRGMMAI